MPDTPNPFANSPPLPLFDPTIARVLGATASGNGVRLDLVSEIGTEYGYTVTVGVTVVTVDGRPQPAWTAAGLVEWVVAMCKFGRLDVRLRWDMMDNLQRTILAAAFTTGVK